LTLSFCSAACSFFVIAGLDPAIHDELPVHADRRNGSSGLAAATAPKRGLLRPGDDE
jgi:hypothetical protein